MKRRGWVDGLLVFALACAYLSLLPTCFNLIDEGILADTAERIHRGEVLYRDVFVYWNPGGFWLCAALFRIAGVGVDTLRISMILFGAAAAVGVWRLAADHGSRVLAILAGLAAPLVCLPIWWMASSHWYSTFTAIAAMIALDRCVEGRRPSLAAVATGVLGGATFVILQPVGAFMLATMGAVLAWDGIWTGPRSDAIRRVGLLALGALVPIAAMYAYFAAHGALGTMIYDTLLWNLRHFRTNLSASYGQVGVLLATDGPLRVVRIVLMLLPPAVYLWALASTGARYVGRALLPGDRRLFALAAVGAGLLASNYYFPDLVHLAFAAPPAFAVVAVWAARRSERSPQLVRASVGLLLAFVLFAGTTSVVRQRATCRAEISTPRGTVAVPKGSVRERREVFAFLTRKLPPGEPLYVYPVGPGYNFLLDRPNPAPYVMASSNIPGYFLEDQSREMVAALERRGVRYVVVPRHLSGSSLDRVDRPLERFIRANFLPVREFERTLILERSLPAD